MPEIKVKLLLVGETKRTYKYEEDLPKPKKSDEDEDKEEVKPLYFVLRKEWFPNGPLAEVEMRIPLPE